MTRLKIAARSAALLATAGLAACDTRPQAPEAQNAPTAVTIRNDFHDRMLRLDDLQRGAALRRAIRASGERCDRVEASAFQQDHENLKMWTARCQATTYAVYLAADGDVQVRPCAQAAQLGLPECRAAESGPP